MDLHPLPGLNLRAEFQDNWHNWRSSSVVLGPGIITANVDNDAGGITTYSIAGAHFGYSLLWTLIPITIALFVVQEMCARMGVVTGKGLADLIREYFGVKPTVILLMGIIIANLCTTTAEFAGVAASMEIFGVSKYISVPVAAALVWLIVVKGNRRSMEKIFLIASSIYITYIISGLMLHPDWKFLFTQTVTPSVSLESGYLYMVIGTCGNDHHTLDAVLPAIHHCRKRNKDI